MPLFNKVGPNVNHGVKGEVGRKRMGKEGEGEREGREEKGGREREKGNRKIVEKRGA